jgi:2-keto-4-pentenoate hydratase
MSAEAVLDPREAASLAEALYVARRDRVAIPPLTQTHPGMSARDGYAVQQHLVDRLLGDGDEIIGYKLGLTSAPMQQMLGVDQPDYGPVLASTVYPDGGDVPTDSFIAPRMEGEIAVVLGSDLLGPGCTAADARAATAGIQAALEIVDSRVADWRIALPDTIADLASNGAVAFSGRVVPVSGFDPRLVGMVFTRNDELVATGAGAAALGDPLHAVAWLANTLAPMGVTLRAGHVVMTGALHAAVPVAPGDTFRAEFDRIGSVSVRMV